MVAYRSTQHLQACLNSIHEQTFQNFEVVIVDNDCPERCTEQIMLPDHRFKIVRANSNLGFAAGVNLGASGAKSEWIITLNPDAKARASWLQELVEASKSSPEFDMLGSTLLNAEEDSIVDGFGDVASIYGFFWRGGYGSLAADLPDENQEVFGACAAAAGYRREIFEKFGGFDEPYFCYLEDADLSFRFQNANLRCLQVRDAIVLHFGGKSSDPEGRFSVSQTYKNNLRLIVRNAPALVLFPMILTYLTAQAYTIARNWRSPLTRTRLEGVWESFRLLPAAFSSRKNAQKYAVASSFRIVKRLTWRPSALKRQQLVTFGPIIP